MKITLRYFIILLLANTAVLNSSYSQNIIYSQDFEDPTLMDWTLNVPINFLGTVASTNNFFQVNNTYPGGVFNGNAITDTDPQIASIDGAPFSNYLHVTSFIAQANLIENTNYIDVLYSIPPFNIVNQELISVFSPDYSTEGYTDVGLDFHWLSGASTTGFGTQLFYSTDFGINWIEIGTSRSDSSWYNEVVDMTNLLDDLPNVRFAFVFNNDLGGSLVGFALDDFKITAECQISLGEDYSVCSGETTNIQADTTFFNAFNWNTGSTSDNIDVVVNSDTTIILSVSNVECPLVLDTLNISVQFERPVISLEVQAEINGIGISCYGDSSGVLTAEIIGGTSNADSSYNVSWFDSNMNPVNQDFVEQDYFNNFTSILTNVYEGQFFVEVTDAVCFVPVSDSIEISSNVEILNTFDEVQVSCFGFSDGMLTANPSGGVAPYNYDWGFYGTNQSISGLATGAYSVVITDSVGCPMEFTTNIVQPNQLLVDASILSEISCTGLTDGILTAVAYGGTVPSINDYYFVWSHPNFDWVDNLENNLQTLGSLPPSVLAVDALNPNYQDFTYPYTVTVSDENGCEATSDIYLVEPQELEIFVSQDILPAYCNNNNPGFNTGWAQVSAQGGTPNQNNNYDFVWSIDGQTDQDVLYSTIESVNSGSYSVTVVDQRLCADQIEIEVAIEPTWQSYTSSIAASCFGSNDGAVSIQMEGGCGDVDNSCNFTYQWQGGGATGNNLQNVPGLQQGNFSVIVTDEWDCQATYTVVVDGPTAVEYEVTSLVDQSCFSATGTSDDGEVEVNVNGGNAPYNVFWIDEAGNQNGPINTPDITSVSDLAQGVWELQVFDDNGCVGVFDVASLHPNPFVIDPGIEVTAVINTDDLFLTDTIRCFEDDNASAIVVNPNPQFSYSWYSSANPGVVIDQGNSTNSLPAGDIFVMASYQLGLCTQPSVPVTIEQMPSYILVENHVAPSCFGDSDAVINLTVNGATPYLNNFQQSDYNFEWFPLELNGQGVVQTNGQLQLSIENVTSGTYFLQVMDRYGCDTVFNIAILDPDPLTADIITQNLSCNSANANEDGQIQVLAIGGTPPYQNFNIQGAQNQTNNSGNFNNLIEGNYNVSFQDSEGCSSMTTTISLSQPPALVIDLESSLDVLCNGDNSGEIQLSAVGGTQPYFSYEITNPGSNTQANGLFQNLVAGTYTIQVEDENGCTDEDEYIIDEPQALTVPTFTVVDASCFNFDDGQINMNINGGLSPYVFNWSNGDNTEDLMNLSSGNYSVTITDENGCTQNGATFVSQPNEIMAQWLIPTPGANGQSIVSQPAPFTVNFVDVSIDHDSSLTEWWINGENSSSLFFGSDSFVDHTFRQVGEYEVTMFAYNSNGCFDTVSVSVTVQGINHINAFSPNGDNINDFFYFENYGIVELNAVIFNRWGDKIYEMNTPDEQWNGISLNGLEVPEGVYFFVLNTTGEDGSTFQEKGSVSLFK
jgi:gliding motility-associated-like protein